MKSIQESPHLKQTNHKEETFTLLTVHKVAISFINARVNRRVAEALVRFKVWPGSDWQSPSMVVTIAEELTCVTVNISNV